jgi:inorganic pyrophosphatase/exopolyphosphatase
VLGNEAADLDSVVSTIVMAYYTALSLAKEEKVHYLSKVTLAQACSVGTTSMTKSFSGKQSGGSAIICLPSDQLHS